MPRQRYSFQAAAAIVASAVLASTNAQASQLVTVLLDLDDPVVAVDPTQGVNVFQTDFDITAAGATVTASAGVEYTDEPGKTGIRAELDVDLSDPQNPVVNTIKFVGELGDIDHALINGPSIMDTVAGFNITLTPMNIGSFIATEGAPVAVGADGKFVSGNTSLNVVEGSVDVLVAPIIGPTLLDENFPIEGNQGATASNLTDNAESTLDVSFDRTENGMDFYSVMLTTPLSGAESTFPVDLGTETGILSLSITGNFVGTGSFAVPTAIPEPATAGLVLLAGCLPFARRTR